MFTSAIKKQTSVCSFYFIKSFKYGISNLEIWNHRKKKRKRKAILLLAYIADVSCLTNCPFYMRTLSLKYSKVRHSINGEENNLRSTNLVETRVLSVIRYQFLFSFNFDTDVQPYGPRNC